MTLTHMHTIACVIHTYYTDAGTLCDRVCIKSVTPHLPSYRVSLAGGLSSTPVQVRVITGDRSCITVSLLIRSIQLFISSTCHSECGLHKRSLPFCIYVHLELVRIFPVVMHCWCRLAVAENCLFFGIEWS